MDHPSMHQSSDPTESLSVLRGCWILLLGEGGVLSKQITSPSQGHTITNTLTLKHFTVTK